MKGKLLAGTSAVALLLFSQGASAGSTLVGTIIGAYDAECTSTCAGLPSSYTSNGGSAFDTPSLFIINDSATTMTSVQLVLTGYQDAAGAGNGDGSTYNASAGTTPATLTLALPNIAGNSVYQLIWGNGGVTASGGSGNNLFANDYDDELGNVAGSGTSDASGHKCGTNDTGNPNICAFVGNFDVKFTALIGAQQISSNFSPDNTQDGGNVAGAFVPWEGLDVDGLSETYADTHEDTFPGTLANIFTGTNQRGGTPVPEPGTLSLLGAGLGALAVARRRRKGK